jgi:hypothetical protein
MEKDNNKIEKFLNDLHDSSQGISPEEISLIKKIITRTKKNMYFTLQLIRQ